MKYCETFLSFLLFPLMTPLTLAYSACVYVTCDSVCGLNGKTYQNDCWADNAGVETDYPGKCRRTSWRNKYGPRSHNRLLNSNSGSSEECGCTREYDPVCGADRETHTNMCVAKCEGIQVLYRGECGTRNYIQMCGYTKKPSKAGFQIKKPLFEDDIETVPMYLYSF